MPYEDFKDLTRRTATDKILRDRAFNIAKNPKYEGYQKGLASMVHKFFDKNFASLTDKSAVGSGVTNKDIKQNLHKPIIRNFKKSAVYSRFKGNVLGADSADMFRVLIQLICFGC